MGKHQIALLKHCILYSGWHTLPRYGDIQIRRAALRLVHYELLELSDTGQVRLKKDAGE